MFFGDFGFCLVLCLLYDCLRGFVSVYCIDLVKLFVEFGVVFDFWVLVFFLLYSSSGLGVGGGFYFMSIEIWCYRFENE